MINKILAKWHKFKISVRTLKREVVYVTVGNPDWRTFSRRVTAPWWRQWAKSQVLTNQNSKNRWCQIVRWTNWQRLQVYGFNEIMRREVQRSSSRLDYRGMWNLLRNFRFCFISKVRFCFILKVRFCFIPKLRFCFIS